MTEQKTLRDFIELAAQRRETTSGRRLAEIAQAAGYDISHSTVNRIRKGDYLSAPTTAILKAIAFLAKEPEDAVFAAAAEPRDWADFENAFDQWFAARERFAQLTDRYARLRGLSSAEALSELEDLAHQSKALRAGESGWYPPWDPSAVRAREEVFAENRKKFGKVFASPQQFSKREMPAAARDQPTESEGRRRRNEQDRAAEDLDT